MPATLQTFIATEDELQLAEKLLEVNNWKRSDSLSVDTALGIFKQTGLSFKQLREIWTIADKNGAGSLTRDELTVAIRLMGWVQSGAQLSEALLAQRGPLPRIKGVTDSTFKKDEIPNITALDVNGFRAAFNQLGAVNGRLDRERAKQVYMQSGTSFDQVEQIMSHLNVDLHGTIDFNDFALGMHLVQTLKSGLISAVPSKIFPEVYKILALLAMQEKERALPSTNQAFLISSPQPSSLHNVSPQLPWTKALPWLPADVEIDLQRYMETIERVGGIPGDIVLELVSRYGVPSAEIATIWNRSHTAANVKLSSKELSSIRSLLHKRLADETMHQRPSAPPPDRLPQIQPNIILTAEEEKRRLKTLYQLNSTVRTDFLSPTPDTDLLAREAQRSQVVEEMTRPQRPFIITEEEKAMILARYQARDSSILQEDSARREVTYETSPLHPPSPSPRFDPPVYSPYSPSLLQRTLSPLPRAAHTSNSIHQDDLSGLREQILRLTSRLEQMDVERATSRDDFRQTNESLRKEMDHFKVRERSLENAVEEKDEEVSELRKSVSSLQWDVLEHQVLLREKQEALANVTYEANELRKTVEIQNKQIAELADLATDMGKAIADTPSKPDNTDLRVLFIRASLRDAQAEAAKAKLESDNLRLKAEVQNQKILELQQRLVDMEANNELSVLRREMEESSKVLKIQMQEMQDALQRTLLLTGSSEQTAIVQKDMMEESSNVSDSEPGSPLWSHSSPLTPVPQINVDDLASLSMSDADLAQLESDLQLFKRNVERKGYIGPEVIERFISEYDIEAADLDEIGQLADANDDNRLSSDEIDAAIVLLRKKLTGRSGHHPRHRSRSLSLTSNYPSTSSEYDGPELTWSSALTTGRSSSLATPLPNPFSPTPHEEVDDDIYVSSPDAPVLLKRSYQPDKRMESNSALPNLTQRPVTLHDDPGQRYLFS